MRLHFTDGIHPYEQERLERIAANEAFLLSTGLLEQAQTGYGFQMLLRFVRPHWQCSG